jgi:MFS family permease
LKSAYRSAHAGGNIAPPFAPAIRGTESAAEEALLNHHLQSAVKRAARRLVPFLLLMYIIAFLDRANISFAKHALELREGIGPRVYAMGAGIFFVGYALLEIPSNLILHRIGARRWLARIMVTWGLISAATIFVEGSRSFYLLRLLLGAAEAGFFPGVILYLTYWFPARERGRIYGLFYFGAPLAFIIGSPVSGLLLQLHWSGPLENWQWMFLIEGGIAVVTGIWAYWYLDRTPEQAQWLTAEEKQALQTVLAREMGECDRSAESAPGLRDRRVLHLVLIYFLIQMSTYGVVFYLPAEVAALLHRNTGLLTGAVSSIPWICALFAAYWLPRRAARSGRYGRVGALTLVLAGCATLLLPAAGAALGLFSLCIAAAGFIGVQPLFWSYPANYLSGRAAAAGLAIINAVGNIGGFFAPNVKVWTDSWFSSGNAGIVALALFTLMGAALFAALPSSPLRQEQE